MQNSLTSLNPAEKNDRLIAFVVLSFLGLLVCLARLPFFYEPMQWDIALYTNLGRGMLDGHLLYADLWDHKPPAIYITYALAWFLTGNVYGSIYLLYVLSTIISMLGVYSAASAGKRGRQVGLWAAAFWVIIAADNFSEAAQPNAEIFINPCLVWSFALLLRDDGKGSGTGRALGVGALWVVATLYKPNMIFYPVVLGLAHILFAPGGASNRMRALKQVLVMAAVGVGGWVFTVGYFAASGRFVDFWDLVVVYNQFYGGSIFQNIIFGLRPEYIFPKQFYFFLPLLVMTGIGYALGPWEKPHRHTLLLIAFALPTQLAVSAVGNFFPHYFLHWFPLVAIAGAWGLDNLKSSTVANFKVSAKVVGAVVLFFLALIQLPYYNVSMVGLTYMKYQPRFTLTDAVFVGKKIDRLLLKDETFLLWGWSPQLYMHAQRIAPEGICTSLMFSYGPLENKFKEKAFVKFSRNLPELLVWSPESEKINRFWRMILTRYEPFPNDKFYSFKLYFRKGGALEARIMKQLKEKFPSDK